MWPGGGAHTPHTGCCCPGSPPCSSYTATLRSTEENGSAGPVTLVDAGSDRLVLAGSGWYFLVQEAGTGWYWLVLAGSAWSRPISGPGRVGSPVLGEAGMVRLSWGAEPAVARRGLSQVEQRTARISFTVVQWEHSQGDRDGLEGDKIKNIMEIFLKNVGERYFWFSKCMNFSFPSFIHSLSCGWTHSCRNQLL